MKDLISIYGHRLVANGYSPVPLNPDTGLPACKGWDELRTKPMDAGKLDWFGRKMPDAGLGVVGGFNGLVPIDIDTDDPDVLAAVKRSLPRPMVARRGTKGFILFYRGTGIQGRNFHPPRVEGASNAPLVEIKANGVATIPPTLHRKTKRAYHWTRTIADRPARTLFDTPIADLSEITPAHIAALAKALEPWCPPPPVYVPPKAVQQASKPTDKRLKGLATSALSRACMLLSTKACDRNVTLLSKSRVVGKFVHHGLLTQAEVEAAFIDACKANGYFAKVGHKQCLWTIRSGIKRAASDPLPELQDRPKSAARARQHTSASA